MMRLYKRLGSQKTFSSGTFSGLLNTLYNKACRFLRGRPSLGFINRSRKKNVIKRLQR